MKSSFFKAMRSQSLTFFPAFNNTLLKSLESTQSLSVYDPSNHSLLKQIYVYPYGEKSCGYLLVDEKTKSLISIDPGEYILAKRNIEMLTIKNSYKFTHILTTHYHQDFDETPLKLKRSFPEIEVIVGNYGQPQGFSTKKVNEIQPFTIGDLAICLLHTPGHTMDSCTYAITHVNSQSTKLPVLFTGDTLLMGSCGSVFESNFKIFYQSLEKLKVFPNETLIFPSEDNYMNNLIFIKTLDPKNEILNMKMKIAEQSQKNKRSNVPSLLYEEKLTNPYLRCNEKYFKEFVKEKDPIKVFMKIKRAQQLILSDK